MKHPWDKRSDIVFFTLLVCGIALCIGGIWLPPLLVPGGICLSGAFGMFASSYVRMYPWSARDEAPATCQSEPVPPSVLNVNIDDHHVEYHPHYDMILRQANPSLEIMEQHQRAEHGLQLI